MKAYLDNNIIVSLENGDYSLSRLIELIPNSNIEFYYSSSHQFELESFKGSKNESKENLNLKRFNTITKLTQNRYLYIQPKSDTIVEINMEPQEAYETISTSSIGLSAMNSFVNLIPKNTQEDLRKEMGIDITKLNNYNKAEIIEQLNYKLAETGSNQSFLDIIESSIKTANNSSGSNLDLRTSVIFGLLDLFGYWKDKFTATSNYARLWDSQHAYFATYCDYFISDDKSTRNKTEVVCEMLNFSTKIISTRKD